MIVNTPKTHAMKETNKENETEERKIPQLPEYI